MIEELKDEQLVEKVGGRFRLTSLIQKRLAVLNKGSLPLAKDPTGKDDNMQIVVREILEDKIHLDLNDEIATDDSASSFNPEV